MQKWQCSVCGYLYDPEQGDPDNGVNPGTSFEDIPEDWVCPVCGASKDEFEKVETVVNSSLGISIVLVTGRSI